MGEEPGFLPNTFMYHSYDVTLAKAVRISVLRLGEMNIQYNTGLGKGNWRFIKGVIEGGRTR